MILVRDDIEMEEWNDGIVDTNQTNIPLFHYFT